MSALLFSDIFIFLLSFLLISFSGLNNFVVVGVSIEYKNERRYIKSFSFNSILLNPNVKSISFLSLLNFIIGLFPFLFLKIEMF